VTLDFKASDFTKPLRPDEEDSDKPKLKPLIFWLKQRKILINLIVMTLVWLGASFNFYLIQFLLTSFDQVYLSTIFSCMSDMLGYSTGGFIFKVLGVKKT